MSGFHSLGWGGGAIEVAMIDVFSFDHVCFNFYGCIFGVIKGD